MKKTFVKFSAVAMMAFATTLSLSSCGGEENKEETTEAHEGDHKCEEGKCEEGKCEHGDNQEHTCEGGKCEGGEAADTTATCEGGEVADSTATCEGGEATEAPAEH